MKKFLYAAAVALVFCAAQARAEGFQVDSVRVGPASDEKAADASETPAPKKDDRKAAPSNETRGERRADSAKESTQDGDKKKDSHPAEKAQSPSSLSNSTASTVTAAGSNKPSATSDAPARLRTDTTVPVGTPVNNTTSPTSSTDSNRNGPPSSPSNSAASAANPPAPVSTAATAAPLTSVYRIGIGDVLDIRMLNDQDPRQSTLYTVLAGGVLDYPLLRDPLTVAGMTTDELAAQLIADFRHRGIYEHPQLRVSVREYASHAVLVSGLAGDPGTKILRREAIPLYVVVAEAQPKPEAGRAVIISHATGKIVTVDLNDAAGLNTLVQPGDVVNLTVRPPEFFYIGGEVSSPGQKDFHAGMTLTQAVLASGGATSASSGRVRVSRAGPDGRLVSTEYNLVEIEGGQVPDPAIQAGDRIEIQRAGKGRK